MDIDTKRLQSAGQAPDQPIPVVQPDAPAVDEVPALQATLAAEEAEEKDDKPLPAKKPRGFAAMDRAVVREIARRGARASQEKGTAHRFTSDEARAAGRKGGSAPHRIRGRGSRAGERPGA